MNLTGGDSIIFYDIYEKLLFLFILKFELLFNNYI